MTPLLHIGVGGPEWLNWIIHPDAILLAAVLEWGYLYAIRELRPRASDAGRVKRSQLLCFHLGVLTLLVAGGSPLHDLGEQYLLSAHMFQHLLLTLVAPPLLIAGTPAWLWQAFLRLPGVMAPARFLTKPLIAFSLFNAVQLLTHLPPTVDLALNVGAFHFLVHAVLVVTAMIMWWPILSPVPELPRLSYPLQMSYLFLQSLLPSVMAAFITFADHVVYPFYADAPSLWGIDPMHDQQTAGLIMKLLGSLILWSFMTVAFFEWYGKEEAKEKGPRWDEIEQELDKLGLTKR
ncbi:MAG: cytochrome c oxidase assembly protein [Dehalococcoidia bacterium]